MGPIRFGTDGWRARMGREFSFHNIRLFAHGYIRYLRKRYSSRDLRVIVNYDTRLLSRRFALETARILSIHEITALIPSRDAPLPAVALGVVRNSCQGAVNFTASFNQPIYNGIKVLTSRGAPAMPSETALIEKEIDAVSDSFRFKPLYADESRVQSIDLKSPYIDYLEGLVKFSTIKSSGIKIVVDNLYGSSRDYLDDLLNRNEIEIQSIHNFPYSAVGAVIPSCSRDNLRELSRLLCERSADIGLATDIDGDRFGILDGRGRFVDANRLMPSLIEYLITVRRMTGGIVKSISTTDNVKRVADYYLRRLYNTPVGFKYLADVMRQRRTFIGVESTNGASLNSDITIKDGILFNLLVSEMLAVYGLPLDQVLKRFHTRFSRLYNREISLAATGQRRARFAKLVAEESPAVNGFRVRRIERIDGIKFHLPDGWLLIRESGTNPVLRIYAESDMAKKTRELIKAGRTLLG